MEDEPKRMPSISHNPGIDETASRIERYRKVAVMLTQWSEQEDDYDERTWPPLEKELRDGGMRCREHDIAA